MGDYEDICMALKTGEYDGVTIMQARLAIEDLQKQLADLKASLPKVRADAIRQLAVDFYGIHSEEGFDIGDMLIEHADKLEAGNE